MTDVARAPPPATAVSEYAVGARSYAHWRTWSDLGGSMIRRKSILFTAAGSLALAVGIGLRLWMSSDFVHFATGFLLGVSIALLILGLAPSSRRVSR
jgi:hypothetical protein